MKSINYFKTILFSILFSFISVGYVNYYKTSEPTLLKTYFLIGLIFITVVIFSLLFTDKLSNTYDKVVFPVFAFSVFPLVYSVILLLFLLLLNCVLPNLDSLFVGFISLTLTCAGTLFLLIKLHTKLKNEIKKDLERAFALSHAFYIFISTILSGLSILVDNSEYKDWAETFVFLLVITVINNTIFKAYVKDDYWA